ncbi:MAG: hypothetical protein OMM_09917 [Candidatus Magnetoglobus multicellularis str. Araruama]|uniref:Uncharacterized protein n=1 Tax=Candidatus Magnetoglobus multicellularis str. Araruama TaxID=890399 RepID=A0A1V1P2P3_9BACT|nr:MAG: hypothetical protein OMM_09917 [Candidatus Magnetoglobus multicellularis str. Araruama]
MNIKFKELKELENNRFISNEDKRIACKRFLSNFSKQNPFSNEDDHMRSYAKKKLHIGKIIIQILYLEHSPIASA